MGHIFHNQCDLDLLGHPLHLELDVLWYGLLIIIPKKGFEVQCVSSWPCGNLRCPGYLLGLEMWSQCVGFLDSS